MMIKMIVIMKSLLCKPKTACDRANIVSELLFLMVYQNVWKLIGLSHSRK